jgi:hypothetical protein
VQGEEAFEGSGGIEETEGEKRIGDDKYAEKFK